MVADGSASSLMASAPAASPQAALRTVTLASATDFAGFRRACRELWAAQVAPDRVSWHCADDAELDLFDGDPHVGALASAVGAAGAVPPVNAPAAFLPLSESVVLHRDPDRFGLLYRLLWRLQVEPGLRADPLDPDWRARRRDGAGGAARHAQDEGVRALPHDRRRADERRRRCTSPGSSPTTTSSRRRRRSSRAASPPCAGRS